MNTPPSPSPSDQPNGGSSTPPATRDAGRIGGVATTANITADTLIEQLLAEEVITDDDLVQLLGANRDNPTLPELEKALVTNNIVSNRMLLHIKGMIGGRQVLDDPSIGVNTDLDRKVAQGTGSLLLDVDSGRPTVAMIEDRKELVDILCGALDTRNIDVWYLTTTQFKQMFIASYKKRKKSSNLRPLGTIFDVIDDTLRREASDLHLKVGVPPSLRLHGKVVQLPFENVDATWMRQEIERIAGKERLALLEQDKAVDFAYSYGEVRLRINLGEDRFGMNIAARVLPTSIPKMEDLGLPEAVRRFARLERGLVLVTGPTGSGKSTTLAALMQNIANTEPRHLITLEDPIEYQLSGRKSIISQREKGEHFLEFPYALRQALRQDPDVVLVGEMRDLETIRTAVTAAETGHLVFGTLHTQSAETTLQRLVGAFPPAEQEQVRAAVAYILKGVVSQTLLQRRNGKGMVAAFEIMVGTDAIANNLRKPDGATSLKGTIETSRQDGMMTMDQSLAELVRKGAVRESDARFKARDVGDFERQLGRKR